MLKTLLMFLGLCSTIFASTTVSDANQDLLFTMLAYGKEGSVYLDEIFVALQTKFFKNAYLGIIVIVPLVFLVHYLIIGPKKFSHEGKKYYFFTLFNRVVHAIAAISFILLIPTGLIMMFGSYFGGGDFVIACKDIHAVVTVLFIISVIPMFFMWFKGMLFTGDDIKWLMILGGYLSKIKRPVPAGKFNAGQKMWFWVCTIGGFAMIYTGATLYVQDLDIQILHTLGLTQIEVLRLSIIVHNAVGLAITALFFTHIYMSMFAIKGSLQSIINGYKEKEEVEILHSSYYKELEKEKEVKEEKKQF